MSQRVQEMYISLFGRPADPAGLAYWTAAAAALGQEAAFGAMARSPEFRDEFDELNADEVIEQVYEEAFGRSPEPAGLAYWKGVAGVSPTPEQLAILPLQILSVVSADSFDGRALANKVAVADAFTASLAAQARPGADLSGLNPETMDAAEDLLETVTANPATVASAQARVAEIASQVLTANGVPVGAGPVTPPPVTPVPGGLTVDAAQATNAAAGIFQTIQAAVDAAGAGATINIAAGTYTENLRLKSDLTLVGTAGVVVQSARGEVGIQADRTQNVQIRDVAFAQATALDSHLSAEDSLGLKLENVTFTGNAGIDRDTDGVVIDGADAARLTNVTIIGYGDDGLSVGADDGQSSRDVLLTNVSAINNRGTGIAVGGDEGDVSLLAFAGVTRLEGNQIGISLGDDRDDGDRSGAVTGVGPNGEVQLNQVVFGGSFGGRDIENESGTLVDASLKVSAAPVAQSGSGLFSGRPDETITVAKGAATAIASFNGNGDQIALPWLAADSRVLAVSNFDPAAQVSGNTLFADAQAPGNPYDVIIATGLPGSGFQGKAATWLIIDADANQAYGAGDQIVSVDVVGGTLTAQSLVLGAFA